MEKVLKTMFATTVKYLNRMCVPVVACVGCPGRVGVRLDHDSGLGTSGWSDICNPLIWDLDQLHPSYMFTIVLTIVCKHSLRNYPRLASFLLQIYMPPQTAMYQIVMDRFNQFRPQSFRNYVDFQTIFQLRHSTVNVSYQGHCLFNIPMGHRCDGTGFV